MQIHYVIPLKKHSKMQTKNACLENLDMYKIPLNKTVPFGIVRHARDLRKQLERNTQQKASILCVCKSRVPYYCKK